MPKKALLLYGLICAFVMIVLNAGRMSVFGGMVRFEIYLSIAGFILILLGVFIGIQWITNKSTEGLQIAKTESSNHWGLSPRELEVLELMAAGYTNQEIADKLFISLPTIKSHNSNIYAKMSVKRRTQAIQEALKTGLIISSPKD